MTDIPLKDVKAINVNISIDSIERKLHAGTIRMK